MVVLRLEEHKGEESPVGSEVCEVAWVALVCGEVEPECVRKRSWPLILSKWASNVCSMAQFTFATA